MAVVETDAFFELGDRGVDQFDRFFAMAALVVGGMLELGASGLQVGQSGFHARLRFGLGDRSAEGGGDDNEAEEARNDAGRLHMRASVSFGVGKSR